MTYYYLKQKVSLGDIIDFKGLKVEVTDNLVKSNPDLFVVEEELLPEYWERVINTSNFTKGKIYKIKDRTNLEKLGNFIDDQGQTNGSAPENYKYFKPSTPEAFQRQELLEEAKRKYPVGTRFKSAYSNSCVEIVKNTNFYYHNNSDITANSIHGITVYHGGNWAEVIKPIFKSEDGVDIYEGDTIYYVRKDFKDSSNEVIGYRNYCGLYSDLNIYFSTKEAAEEYVDKNKPKDLKYYEDLLLNPIETYTDYTFCAFNSTHYDWLKNKEPKLYWLKVLELIQQDLDNGWKPDWNDHNCKYRIENYYMSNYSIESYRGHNSGLCNFKSKESAQTAIQIMGDKLDIIFK